MKEITLLLLILTLILSSCDKIKNRSNKYINAVTEELKEPVVTSRQIIDLYPEFKKKEYNVENLNGLQAEYLPAFYEYYFKYSGNKEKVLNFICNLKVETYTEITPDTSCTIIGVNIVAMDKKEISEKMLKNLDFFFEYERLDNYKVYQTIKTPFKHTLIIDQKSYNIYHNIREFKE